MKSSPSYLFRCCLFLFGQKLMCERALQMLVSEYAMPLISSNTHLDSPAKTENTIVRLLGGKTLEGEKNSLGLLGNQIIGSVVQISAQIPSTPAPSPRLIPQSLLVKDAYLNPSCLYPAALQYQLAIGVIILRSHDLFLTKLARDG